MTQSAIKQIPVVEARNASSPSSEDSAATAKLLAVLGAGRRIDVLGMLADGETRLEEIASALGMTSAEVKEHVRALSEAGVGPGRGQQAADVYKLVYHAVRLLGVATTSLPVVSENVSERFQDPETAVPVVPTAPLACQVCDNAGFVRGVLGELKGALGETREYHTRIQEMSSQVMTAHEAERKRIARELHDDTAQAITSILVRLRLLERSTSDEGVLQNVEELRDLASGALDSVRRMAMDLRPASLDDLGLVPALQSYADKYSQSWPIQVNVQVQGLKRRLPRDVELVLYRVAQEALTNVGKHAGATRADVRLSRRRNQVELVIEDNGRGFEVGKARQTDGSGLGLFGMRERLALVDGELEVCSSPDCGTRIRARVPLKSEDSARRAR